jgi:hypothetical protein
MSNGIGMTKGRMENAASDISEQKMSPVCSRASIIRQGTVSQELVESGGETHSHLTQTEKELWHRNGLMMRCPIGNSSKVSQHSFTAENTRQHFKDDVAGVSGDIKYRKRTRKIVMVWQHSSGQAGQKEK